MPVLVMDVKLYALFFLISLEQINYNFSAIKIIEAIGKKNLKCLKDKVCGL